MPKHVPHENAPRFYVSTLGEAAGRDLSDAPVRLDKHESHHARNVLRLSAGDAVQLFDGRGFVTDAVIQSYSSHHALCRIESTTTHPPASTGLTIASAVPKGPRAEAMVDQLSQLGVDRFVPLHTQRSVAIPKDTKLEKFRRLAIESAKQCGRAWLMQVEEVALPEAVWSDTGYDLKLLAEPGVEPADDLGTRLGDAGRVLVLIGPEGGWSDEERASAKRHRCTAWTFAPNVLRIETAAPAAAAILRHITSN